MKVLFIGGTGTISAAISKELVKQGHELYLINRGTRNSILACKEDTNNVNVNNVITDNAVTDNAITDNVITNNINFIEVDINNEEQVTDLIKDLEFDVVADFIAFVPSALERDYRLFKLKTKQFIFISSASAYQKPLSDYRITESTPLSNPYWEYSRNKIACEEYLMKLYREEGFPVTIVRPSHTYDERSIPLGVHGDKGSFQVLKRMMEGKKVIIHGDGSSLWTMTHNRDFAKGFIGLMGNLHAIGESVQITSDETLTWNQIYQAIADAAGVKLNAIHVASEFLDAVSSIDFNGALIGDKANSVVFDNTKLKRLVPGYVAETRFDQGIKEVVEYVLNHADCQTEDEAFDLWCDKVIQVIEDSKAKFK